MKITILNEDSYEIRTKGNPYAVYIIYGDKNPVYIGCTTNLHYRLKQHLKTNTHNIASDYDKWIVQVEYHFSRTEGREREKALILKHRLDKQEITNKDKFDGSRISFVIDLIRSGCNYQKIGNYLGVTRQRAFQIVNNSGLRGLYIDHENKRKTS